MEKNKLHCTLNDKELYEMAEACIQDLIDTGGGSFTMCVPARPNQDTDLIFTELNQRFMKMCHENAALQAKCERYEKALNNIAKPISYLQRQAEAECARLDGHYAYQLANSAPYLQGIANEALSGEGGKEVAIAKICHALAEEVAKDADTAEAYLKKEGVDVEKVKENAKFIAWLAELAALLHGAAQGQPIKINQEEARKWYDDGATPYQCFRETWNME